MAQRHHKEDPEKLAEYRLRRYEEYSKQRSVMGEANLELAGRYDQWILTLSAGAIALSLTFLEKIAPRPAASTLPIVGCAWLCLVVALMGGFVSLLTAQYSVGRQIKILDGEYNHFVDTGEEAPKIRNWLAVCTHWLNVISVITFVVGVSLLCVFAYKNLVIAKAASEPHAPNQSSILNSNVSNQVITIPKQP